MSTEEMGTEESHSFSPDLKELPIEIGGEEYVLVELDGKDRDKYLNNVGARIRVGPDGKPAGVKNFEGLQASLVTPSIRKIVNGERKAVDIKTVQSWPSTMLSKLFDLAKDLSDLKDEEEEKKDAEGNG
jgi:hypothetical protein